MDFFKTVNDVYGHLRGDEVLRQVADRAAALARPGDTLFRYGGDEFVLLLPGAGRSEAVRLALALTDGIRGGEFAGSPPLHLSISLGVASHPADGTTPTDLLAAADRRNYLAKRRGRGGAVADDADPGSADPEGRLWERDAALATAHEYLTRLEAHGRGTLRVAGQPGAGHTRFLAEVGRLAAMRGNTVIPVPPEPEPLPAVDPVATGPVLLLLDVAAAARLTDALSHYGPAAGAARALGVVIAHAGPPPADPALGGPGHPPAPDGAARTEAEPDRAEPATVELAPWSPAALRIWLRAALRGEPSRTLVTWLARQSGGLPAAATRELERLRGRGGVEPTADGGWTVSPALLGRPRRQVRVPAPVTPLVGREAETRRVAALLAGGRLVTLAGPGGIGKTRLSLSVAGVAADDFDDGVTFVPLSEATDADQVLAAVAAALGADEVPGQTATEALADHLANARLLLILDNFEQVIDAGPAIGELLAAAPGVTALVTSREPLNIYGEQVYRVPPLPLPDLAAVPPGADAVDYAMRQSAAVALFTQRAPEFTLTARHLPAVVELCRLLDGLPLAIELVAARADTRDPAELLADLGRHLDTGRGPRDRPARQQTLRGAVDWSYALLDDAERELFRALAVFAGGATPAAVSAVVPPGSGAGELAAKLDGLVAKSLLTAEPDPDGGTRYRMLHIIRAHAMVRLAAAGGDGVHDRHLRHQVGVADRAAAGMTGPDQAEWADRLHREYPNLRAAVEWAMDTGRPADAARICAGLWRYWRNGDNLVQGREWLDRVLARPLPDPLGAPLLYAASVLAITQGDADGATARGAEALRLAERTGDRPAAAQARNTLGIAALIVGDGATAAEHFRYGLAVWRELDQPEGTAIALGNLAKAALRRGAVTEAADHVAECLTLERAAGNRRGVLLGLECLADIRLAQHDPAAAHRTATEALDLARALGDVFGEAMALHQLGLAARATGDHPTALGLFLAALERRHELGDREDLAVSLDCVAGALVETNPALAVRLLGAAHGLRRRHRLPDSPAAENTTVDLARAALPGPAFAAGWSDGHHSPLDLIIDQALDTPLPPVGASSIKDL